MKKRLILFLLIVSGTCSSLFAQYSREKIEPVKYDVEIYTKTGRQYNASIELPKVTSQNVEVPVSNKQVVSLNSADIDSIICYNNPLSKNCFVKLVYTSSDEYKSIKDSLPKFNHQPKWMLRLIDYGNISLYIVAQEYDLNKFNRVGLLPLNDIVAANLWIYLKKKDEPYPTRISLSPSSGYGSNQHFRSIGQKYFDGCDEVVEKIANGEWTNQHFEDILSFYSKWADNH